MTMTPDEHLAKIDARMAEDARAEAEMDHIRERMILPEPVAPSEAIPNKQIKWTKEAAKGADLGDAIRAGMRDPEADVTRSMSDMSTSAQDYHRKLVELLTSLSSIMEDGMNDFERLQARFTRNP